MTASSAGLLALLTVTASCGLYFDDDREGVRFHGPDAGATPDPSAPMPEPILHYRFDDTLANDGVLGHDFDGSGTSYSFVAGKRGRAVAFDTTRDTQVVLPTQVPLSSGSAYTVGLWFREETVWNSGGFTQYLFDNRGAGGFQTYHGVSGNEALTTCSDAGCQAIGYAVGSWHHLLYRYDGTSGEAPLEIFLDGTLAAMLPASDVYFSTTQKSIAIGVRTNMQVDDLTIYAEVFSVERQCAIVVGGTWTNGCTLP